MSAMRIAAFGAVLLAVTGTGGRAASWGLVMTWPPPPLPGFIRFDTPSSVAIDVAGRVLIAHRGEPVLLRYNRDGTFDKGWGTGFKTAHGLKVAPDGAIWVTDRHRHVIIKYSADGEQLQMLGSPDQPGGGRDRFGGVSDLAFLPNGDFYVTDGYDNSRVVKFDKAGNYLFEWGQKGAGPGQFNLPHAVALDAKGQVYVADRENHRIQVFGRDGTYITQWKVGTPYGLAMTTTEELWVADGDGEQFIKLNLQGQVIESFTAPDPNRADRHAHLIAVDADGAVYSAETRRNTVRKFATR